MAKAAGVSVASVSRAFQPGAQMTDVMRERILKIARQLGYAPPSRRSASRLSVGTVTVITGNLSNPLAHFYPQVIELLAKGFAAEGRRLVLAPLPDGANLDDLADDVLGFRTDAVILTSVILSSKFARECRRQSIPVVLFNRIQSDASMTAVTCDNYGGANLVARRFLKNGRRRIAMLGGDRLASTQLERRSGFVHMLETEEVQLYREELGSFTYSSGSDAAERLLMSGPPPDAIFCCNDVMALAAIDVARRRGFRVPDDVAIIGFDDIPMAAWNAYSLTTVRQPVRRMVANTVDLVNLLFEHPEAEGTVRVSPVQLAERNSG